MAVANNYIYVLDMGNYYDVMGGIRSISPTNVVKTLFDCTNATIVGTKIYASNCVYGQTTPDFIVYDVSAGNKKTYPSGVDKFFYPNVVTADPLSGHIFIASYSEDADKPNNPNYSTNGYIVEYDDKGNKLKEYNCGVGPNAIVFNVGIEYVEW